MSNIVQQCKDDLKKIIGYNIEIEYQLNHRNNFYDNFNKLTNFDIIVDDFERYNKESHTHPYYITFSVKNPDADTILSLIHNKCVSYFSLHEIPNSGICLSTSSSVEPFYRKKGVATRLNKFRQEVAAELGFSVLMCTSESNNFPQKKVLEKNGWENIYSFKNDKTNHLVDISVVPLKTQSIVKDGSCHNCHRTNTIGVASCWWCLITNPC